VYAVTGSAATSGVSVSATNPSQGVYNVAVGLTTVPVALGGTNAASFVAPSSGINPIVFYDGTRLNTDPLVTHFGYDMVNDIVYLASLKISAPNTTVATFTNTAGQSSLGGAGMLAYADPTSAVQSGSRLGFMLFGGATDAAHTLVNSTGFAGFGAETWSSTNQGSSMSVYTTPNGSTTAARRVVATFGQDGSATFTGKFMSTHRGDQFQFTNADSSLYREGSWDSASGVAYALPGSLGQYYWTHNVALDNTTGNFLGTDDTGTSTYGLFAENDHEMIFHAPSVTAGTVPTFSASAVYDLNTATGSLSLIGGYTTSGPGIANDSTDGARLVYLSGNAYVGAGAADGVQFGNGGLGASGVPATIFGGYNASGVPVTSSTDRVVNTTATASAVTISASAATTYIDTPSSVSLAITLPAPITDGERHRVCFGGAVTTVSWVATAPATAVDSLPLTATLSQCVEIYYNAAAGVPTNSAATTWYLY
jgi:hypothetical protein